MNISDLIPSGVKAVALNLIDKTEALLQGETARAIGYGGGLIAFLVAKYVKFIPDVDFGTAVGQAVAVEVLIGAFVESIRHYVSSPATVARLTK